VGLSGAHASKNHPDRLRFGFSRYRAHTGCPVKERATGGDILITQPHAALEPVDHGRLRRGGRRSVAR